MTNIHHFDQAVAEADRTLDAFVAEYHRVQAELGDTGNLAMLEESLSELPPSALAPLLAAAIRRLAKQEQP
ncbi:hypothetical protein AB0F72_08430 [Actinoplanes sp. NPDC023936]|uniref:hypothetical protein n=1 Tax=Actinoplanes sp. NPDC023936 TaxID=3154910 RepID=UPI0033F86291